MDVYRNLSFEDVNEFRPHRGNVFKTQERDDDGNIAEKDSLGRIKWRDVTVEESANRRNYRYSDNINFLDGDYNSSIYFNNESELDKPEKWMYEASGANPTSMIDNRVRVYKGGSWIDRVYYISPGNRRYLDERLSTSYIGFRCAMVRLGSPQAY